MKLRELNWVLLFYCLAWVVIIVGGIFMLASCGQVIVRDSNGIEKIKVNTFFKDIDLTDLEYKDFKVGDYEGESKNVDVVTPYGTLSTADSNE